MTNTNLLRTAMIQLLICMAAGSLQAQSPQDVTFLRTATQIHYNEIQFSNLAVQRSSNPEIRAFANRMISDFTLLEQRINTLEKQNNILPAASMDAQHRAQFDYLNQLSGADFDKEYIRIMDADDHAALAVYHDEENSTVNPPLRQIASSGDKVLSDHTIRVDALDRKMGMTPAGKTNTK